MYNTKFIEGDIVLVCNMPDYIWFVGKIGKIIKVFENKYLIDGFDSFPLYAEELLLVSRRGD